MTSYCTQTTKVITKNDCCSPSMRSDKYYVTISVADTWIMPAVNAQTILQIPNCNNLLPGSWLWNGNVGYLRIDAYNSASGEVKVTNIGYAGNAAPDTVFPSCMDFVVTAPILVDEISDNITCLTSDFVSPAVGNCALMTVKSTANLRKDYIIAIDIYQYQISEVMDNTTVKVCNYGLGKIGVIDAPCDGSCLPIRVINAESPCLQDSVNEANGLVSCVGGETRVFVGLEEGQSAYWSNADGSWKLINSNIEVDCTVTATTVNLIAGNVGPYLLNVVTTAPFKVGDRLTFNDEHDAYVVSEIINDLQLRVIKNEAPTEDALIDAGTRICIVDCCDWIPAMVETLEARLTDVEEVNNTQATQITNINKAIKDLENTKADIFNTSDLITSPSGVLDIDRSIGVIFGQGDATISLNTDLSAYDNTVKNFVTDGANVGQGVAVYSNHSDNTTTGDRTLNFRTIKAGTNIDVAAQGSDIVITNTMPVPSPGTTNAMANVGTGQGKVYKGTTSAGGVDTFNIKSLKAGTGISVTNDTDDITITNTATTFNHYSYIYTGDVTITSISPDDVWREKYDPQYPSRSFGSASGTISITNPYNRPLNLFIGSYFRTAYQLGNTDTDSSTLRDDGWADMELTLSIYQKNGNNAEQTITNANIHVQTTMEGQSSANYHVVSNSFPLLTRTAVSYIPANTTSEIRLYLEVKKINDSYPLGGGRLRWISSPHGHIRILAVLD